MSVTVLNAHNVMKRFFKYLFILVLLIAGAEVTGQGTYTISLTPTPESCAAGAESNNGSILLTVNTPGTFTYNYDVYLLPGETLEESGILNTGTGYSITITPLVPGDYRVEVERASSTLTPRIVETTVEGSENELEVEVDVLSNVICNSGSTGSIRITAEEGTGPYEYGYGDGASTSPNSSGGYQDNGGEFEGLSAGSFKAWVRDEFGCERSADFSISQPVAISFDSQTINPNCDDEGGQINLSNFSGGDPFPGGQFVNGYQIVWQDAETGDTLAQNVASLATLAAGRYQVNVIDESTCSPQGTQIELFQGFGLDTTAVNDVTCANDLDGFLEITVELDSVQKAGGQTYSITLSDSDGEVENKTGLTQDTVHFVNLGADTYTVEVIVAGCHRSISAIIEAKEAPELVNATRTNVICKGNSTGTITWEVEGGSGSFRYSIDTGTTYQNSPTFNFLPADNYVLQVLQIVDGDSCITLFNDTNLDFQPITIEEPVLEWYLDSDTDSIRDVSCFSAADGFYSFAYDSAFSVNPALSSNNQPIWTNRNTGDTVATGVYQKNNLGPGEYRVSVTAESGCKDFLEFSISEPAELSIEATAPELDCPVEFTPGGVVIDASGSGVVGGTPPYSYQWLRNNNPVSAGSGGNSNKLTNVSDDAIYTLAVEDDNGCQDTAIFEIIIPENIEVIEVSSTQIACKDEQTGAIEIDVTGGTSPYAYVWVRRNLNGIDTLSTNDHILTDLDSGEYQVYISDSRACQYDSLANPILIADPATSFEITGKAADVTCNGSNDGTIDITLAFDGNHSQFIQASGIEWFYEEEMDPFLTGERDLEGLEPGNYRIVIKDTKDCSKEETFEVREPEALNLELMIQDNSCFGDAGGFISLDTVGAGGWGDYTVHWKIDGAEELDSIGQLELSGLGNGEYQLILSDSSGCSVDSTIVLKAPGPLTITETITNVQCNGDETGTISVQLTGGAEPYAITWLDMDGQIANGVTSIDALTAGTYRIRLDDDHNCGVLEEIYTITEPSTTYDISLDVTQVKCNNGSTGELTLNINAEGGHPADYSVKWYRNGSHVTTQDNATPSTESPLSALNAGTYAVEVTDANGCLRTAEQILTNPTKIFLNPEVTPVSCNGFEDGAITLNPTGGYANYTYSWEYNGSALSGNNSFRTDLPEGEYRIKVTDDEGCVKDSTIQLANPLPIVVNADIASPRCTNGTDGSITLTVTNGTPPYVFEWRHDDEVISTEQDLSGLPAGIYELFVTDQFQCEISMQEYTVSDPPSDFTIEGTIDKVTCSDHTDGVIDVDIVVTGDPDLDYSVYWEKNGTLFSQNTEDLDGIGFGEYELFVTDQYGCVKSRTFSLENPAPLNLEFLVADATCYLESDGSVAVQVTGGYGSYSFEWLKNNEPFSVTGSFANNLEAAFYELTVTDLEGCVITRTVEVEQPDPFLIEVTKQDNTCSTPYDSEIEAVVTGGNPPYELQWFRNGLPYSDAEDLTGIPSGTYQLIATDTNLCETTSAEVVIATPERLGLNILSMENNLCPNTENGSISFQGTGGFFPYTYSFDSLAYEDRNNFLNLADKDYLISVKDNVGCTFDTVITVGNEHELEAEFSLEADEFAIDFPITLTDESLGDNIVQWFWSFGDTRASEDQNTSVTYTQEGTYVITLTVENEVGCRLSKSDTVEIIRGYNFTIPTAFTPNDDFSNDNFRPVFSNVEALNIRIQDRNGELVFETGQLSGFWDGTYNGVPAPQGAYYYEMTFTARSGKVRKERGKVFLLR